MPPQIASIIIILFISFVFIDDLRKEWYKSNGLLIPFFWLLIVSSRAVSVWFNPGQGIEDPDVYLEGSPLDRNIFIFLMVLGIFVLIRRRINWLDIFKNNFFLIALFSFAFLSVVWSEYPIVSLKRYMKAIGSAEMALIVATEADVLAAINNILRRLSFIHIPLSVLFIKYYPDLGRGFTRSGDAQFIGVTLQKNSLGLICMIFGLFYLQKLFSLLPEWSILYRKKDFYITIVFLAMISWLQYMADSATSLLLLIFGIVLLLLFENKFFKIYIKYLGILIIVSVSLFFLFEFLFNVTGNIIDLLGRDITLTGRVPLWEELLKEKINPLFGCGFDSFWLGNRAQYYWDKYWWHPNQAHNGYLEVYLNMGYLGLGFLMFYLLSAYRNIRSHFFNNYPFGKLGLVLFIIILIYNITEGIFFKLDLLWILVIIFSIKTDVSISLSYQINKLINILIRKVYQDKQL